MQNAVCPSCSSWCHWHFYDFHGRHSISEKTKKNNSICKCLYTEFHYVVPKFVSIFLHVKLNKMNTVPSYLWAIKHFKASLLSNWRLFERKFSRIARFELKQNEYHAQLQAPIYMFSFEKAEKKRIKTKCVHIIYPAQKLIARGQCLLLWRLFIFLSW